MCTKPSTWFAHLVFCRWEVFCRCWFPQKLTEEEKKHYQDCESGRRLAFLLTRSVHIRCLINHKADNAATNNTQSGWLTQIHRTVTEKSSRWPLEEEESDGRVQRQKERKTL